MTSSRCEHVRREVRQRTSELLRGAGTRLVHRVGTCRTAAAAAGAWLGAGTGGVPAVLAVCALLLALGVLLLLARPGRRRVDALRTVAGGLAFSAGLTGVLAGAHAHGQGRAPQPESVRASVVSESHETASGRYRALATGEFGRATLIADEPLPPAGTLVEARLDWWDEGLAGVEEATAVRAPGAVWRARADVRAGLARASVGGHEGAELLPGLVIGDTARVSAELEEAMRTVSLTHVTAVSGANILIVAGVVLLVMSRLCRPWWARLLPAACVTAGYVFVVGPEPSVTRATAMAALTAIGLLRPVGTPTVAVLASAVSVLLVWQPQLAGEIGFALSVAATAGILLVAPPLTQLLVDRRVPGWAAAAIAVPAAAQLACTPLLIVLAPQLSPWSVPANLAAGPAVAPATVLGLLAMALEAAGASWPARLFGGLGAFCAWWITGVAHVCAALPAAALRWPEAPGGVVLACVMAAFVCAAVLLRGRSRAAAAVLAFAVAVGGSLVPVLGQPGRGEWSVLVCDVGQGSAVLLRAQEESGDHALLVDTGDDAEALHRCLEGSGVRRLTLAVSHFDRDHVGALDAAVEAAEVHALIVPRALAHTPEAEDARALTGLSGIPAARGEALPPEALPPGVRVRVLWPPPRAGSSADGNGHSLVLLAEADGITVLLPGDIGRTQSLVLASVLAQEPPVDLMLAPHHGSGDMAPALHRAARPRVGAVSVGADNSYGHPTPSALAAFGSAEVLRTDACGTLAVTAGGAVRAEDPDCGRARAGG